MTRSSCHDLVYFSERALKISWWPTLHSIYMDQLSWPHRITSMTTLPIEVERHLFILFTVEVPAVQS